MNKELKELLEICEELRHKVIQNLMSVIWQLWKEMN